MAAILIKKMDSNTLTPIDSVHQIGCTDNLVHPIQYTEWKLRNELYFSNIFKLLNSANVYYALFPTRLATLFMLRSYIRSYLMFENRLFWLLF